MRYIMPMFKINKNDYILLGVCGSLPQYLKKGKSRDYRAFFILLWFFKPFLTVILYWFLYIIGKINSQKKNKKNNEKKSIK